MSHLTLYVMPLLDVSTQAGTTNWWADLGPYFLGLAAIVSTWLALRKFRFEKLTREANDIRRKLVEFYGPFQLLRSKSKELYTAFYQLNSDQGAYWSEGCNRTLAYLLEGNQVTGNSKALLDEMVLLNYQCEQLIHAKAGLVDDAHLRFYELPAMATHFSIFRMAYLKNHRIGDATEEPSYDSQDLADVINRSKTVGLQGNDKLFSAHAFPEEADDLINKRIIILNERLDKINGVKF